jgi:two-component system, NtrC family, nitrogen regulation sensor histidine kinase NtrY
MFRRYPYWGWFIFSLVLWGIIGYNFHMHLNNTLPGHMAATVNKDLRNKENVFENFLEENDVVAGLFKGSLSEKESGRINDFPFFIYAYDKDTLKFWNTNSVIASVNDSAFDKPVLLKNENGVFVERCIKLSFAEGKKTLVVLFPVLITYPLENDYLKSHFAASNNIPVKTDILPANRPSAGAYPVLLQKNVTVFYLHFNPHDIQKWVPDGLFISLLIVALLSSIWWIQLMIIHLTRKKSAMTGFLATVFVILVFRSSLYIFGLPFNLDTLTFFDSRLYASSNYLKSLGDLFITTVCVLWLMVFITRHTPYKTYFDKLKGRSLRFLAGFVLTVALFGYAYLFIDIIRSLVLDSSISFDVSRFYSINVYTILGLFVIGIITGISCLVVYLFNVQLRVLIIDKYTRYILIAFTGAAMVLISGLHYSSNISVEPFDWTFYWILLGWLLLFIILQDVPRLELASDLFEPHMIFWAVFICMFCTGLLQYFNEVKERHTRVAFVQQNLSPRRDEFAEYALDKSVNGILQDKALKYFFSRPSATSRKIINKRLDSLYFSGTALNKYQAKVYLFDINQNELYNKDTTVDYNELEQQRDESASTSSSYLFYNEDIHDLHFYLAWVPVYSDTINNVIGYAIIDFDQKKQEVQTVYPELLQPTAKGISTQNNEYSYAIYVNDKVFSQNDDYSFPTHLDDDTLKKGQDQAFHIRDNILELYYKIDDKRTIVVVHRHSQIIEMITLFSYLFVIQVLIAVIILLYQLYLSYFSGKFASERAMRLTLRRRVHFSMLGVVLVSFIIIGCVTIYFFSVQYKRSNANNYQSAMQLARQSVQEELKQLHAFDSDDAFDSLSRSNRVKSFITTLAVGQKIDINIYNRRGMLLNTSEDEIYNKGLISHMMRPDAYYKLNDLGQSIVIQNEEVAKLSYLSAYQPIRDEHGIIWGFINVPYFSSEKEINFQISNIVITLINLYAFIFLFSSLITVFITRWITQSFNIIIRQFGRINLQRNERISWPYEDEIGLLVSEYNKMVNKVEENAALLAQSERESAWREMARQVAHEIKNPLTPMKLNIQYLQQAMRNNNPDIKELTDKVSYSIIEQIDNLSYIASEFSNFAKMPEARPEELELNELLQKAVGLYDNDSHVKVSLIGAAQKLFVYSDKSQLLRVFTNLLENAKQSIPEDRKGNVEVSVTIEDHHGIITIADNGQGIPDDVVKKLFQPYFTTKSSGTGLGLAMTRKIIEFWKGQIWFETKEGKGTTFYIKLPLMTEEHS